MTIEEAYNLWRKIDLNKIESKTLAELEPEIIDLNRQQLQEGKDNTGSFMPEYEYNDYYNAKRAQGIATAGRHYNLFLTGNLYDKMFMEKTNSGYYVSSSVEYLNSVLNKLDNDPFGLTNESIDELSEDFSDRFNDKLIKAMKL